MLIMCVAGASEHDLLTRITETLGSPPAWMLNEAKHTDKFFKRTTASPPATRRSSTSSSRHTTSAGGTEATASTTAEQLQYALFTKAEFEARNNCEAPAGKRYFSHARLPDIVGHYPLKGGMSDADEACERRLREGFLDLLLGVLDLDPKTRWVGGWVGALPATHGTLQYICSPKIVLCILGSPTATELTEWTGTVALVYFQNVKFVPLLLPRSCPCPCCLTLCHWCPV